MLFFVAPFFLHLFYPRRFVNLVTVSSLSSSDSFSQSTDDRNPRLSIPRTTSIVSASGFVIDNNMMMMMMLLLLLLSSTTNAVQSRLSIKTTQLQYWALKPCLKVFLGSRFIRNSLDTSDYPAKVSE